MSVWDKLFGILSFLGITANLMLNLHQGDMESFVAWLCCYFMWDKWARSMPDEPTAPIEPSKPNEQ